MMACYGDANGHGHSLQPTRGLHHTVIVPNYHDSGYSYLYETHGKSFTEKGIRNSTYKILAFYSFSQLDSHKITRDIDF